MATRKKDEGKNEVAESDKWTRKKADENIWIIGKNISKELYIYIYFRRVIPF